MPRKVVTQGTPRCGRCRMTLRWCVCGGEKTIASPLAIDIIFTRREFWRPTSTGRLINRVIPASRGHVCRHDQPPDEQAIRLVGRELWILHPLGEPLADVQRAWSSSSGEMRLEELQVLLLDGSWREASQLTQRVNSWGRLVSLPMTGPSRYRLRDQQGAGNHSTVEALLFLLEALGLEEQHAELQLQFELHVYAGLRVRGSKAAAEAFLASSPLRIARPELLEDLNRRRPRDGSG